MSPVPRALIVVDTDGVPRSPRGPHSGLPGAVYFHIIGSMETKNAVAALAALAQESRLAVYRLLVKAGAGGMAAGAIADKVGVPAATLSFHLKTLAGTDLVRAVQNGRFIVYSANFDVMADLVAFLTENCCSDGASAIECARLPKLRTRVKR